MSNVRLGSTGPRRRDQSQRPTDDRPVSVQMRGRQEIHWWLSNYLAALLGAPSETVDTRLSFESHGLDSAAAVSLVADLEDWTGLELDPTIVYDYPTVAELTDFLVAQLQGGAA
jgi:acyl carrier protein